MRHYHIDIDELKQLWEADWSAPDLAERFRCTQTMIYVLSKRYSFPPRESLQSREPPPPSRADDTASADSLALSPWVAERAAEFRREKEARGETVYSSVHLKTYSLRTLQPVSD